MIVNIHPGGRMQEVAGAFGLRWGPRPFSPKFPEFLMLKSFLFNQIALLGNGYLNACLHHPSSIEDSVVLTCEHHISLLP